MDWDEDGRKDLILGERDGYIRIYLNTNTDDNPMFNGFNYLKLGASNYDVGLSSSPYIVDWDNDGRKDILCGEDYGTVRLLLNTGTNAAPVFTTQTYILNGASNLDVGGRSSPVVFDWDGDGKKDLLVGETYGNIFFFRNIGTDASPSFSGYTLLQAGGLTIDVGYYSRFEMADWDNDSVTDLICGQYDTSASPTGGVLFFHALGALSVDANTLSAGSGGSSNFALKAGAAYGGRNYFLLGSSSGTEPGITLPGGAVLPLNWDSITSYTRIYANNAVLGNFRAALDNTGEATATLTAAMVPLAVGTIVHFAYTTETPYDFQSNPVPVEIVP